ncbi:tubulin/FtsZ family protein [Halarchaeum acidiphilum]|uniref:tubulin/FtsZ family protein n=1 Tax=Halarchaeum acidiphilum TaxID=489138 RepID=UPI0005D16055|nr:hypothetical protein [Halarchaeum acidiphilum]
MVDRVLEVEADTGRAFTRGNALVCDISRTPTDGFDAVPEEQRVLIGDTHAAVTADGLDGEDVDLAAEVTRTDLPEIRRALDSLAIHDSDAVLVVAGLGDATGSGAGSVLVEELQGTYDEPLYALGVLPADDDGGRAALNAARSLRSIVPTADSTLTFDREMWPVRSDGDDDDPAIRALATRVATLFAAGELDADAVAENAMDSSDLIRTLDPGGIASIGYASTDVQPDERGVLARLLAWFRSDDDADETTDAAKVKGLVRQAAGSRLTTPAEVSSAERALVVLSGPPSELSRRGFESARQWLEQEADTVEILAGDDPRPRSSTLEAVVLFSNVTDVPRVDELQSRAVDTQDALAAESSATGDGATGEHETAVESPDDE